MIFTCAGCVLVTSGSAWAFHAGNVFDASPGNGGGGGLFYTGSARERGWTCAACHLHAARRTRVGATADPPELISGRSYTPGQTYRLSFSLDNEYLGVASPRSNYNTIVITAVTREGSAAGSFSGYSAQDYYARGSAILASAGRSPNETNWSFDWTAPDVGNGLVRIHIAVVDGNGGNSDATSTLTDPFGDDFALGEIALSEGGTALGGAMVSPPHVIFRGSERVPPSPRASPWKPDPSAPTQWPAAAAALAAVLALIGLARLGRRNAGMPEARAS